MTTDDGLKKAIARRRDKAIAVILRAKENEADEFLPNKVSADLRKVILDQINEFHDLVVNLVDVNAGGYTLNEDYLLKLQEIHSVVVGENGGSVKDNK